MSLTLAPRGRALPANQQGTACVMGMLCSGLPWALAPRACSQGETEEAAGHDGDGGLDGGDDQVCEGRCVAAALSAVRIALLAFDMLPDV